MKHFFTFGSDHLNGSGFNKYVEIKGDIDSEHARSIILAMFGFGWSGQYTEAEFIDDFATVYWLTRYMLIEITKG